MAQAATLTQQQLERVLDYLRTRRHYNHNRTIILLMLFAMLRVGEVAALCYCDILKAHEQVKAEITLTAE
jgi:integrase/recombinase XerD